MRIQMQALALGAGLSVAAAATLAPPVAGQDDSGGQALGQAANDPTASLMSYQAFWLHSTDYRVLDDEDGDSLLFRAAIPFQAFDHANVFRISIPVVLDQPGDGSGLSDITLFNLTTFDQAWGRWGAGVVGLIPTGEEDVGAEKWAVGPAIGFINSSNPKILWGAFNQNLFSFAGEDERRDVNVSVVQPIVNYQLGGGWSVGSSEMQVTYDWDESDFVALPLGLALQKLTRISGKAVQVVAQYEHDFADDFVGPEDTFWLGVKLLLPA